MLQNALLWEAYCVLKENGEQWILGDGLGRVEEEETVVGTERKNKERKESSSILTSSTDDL